MSSKCKGRRGRKCILLMNWGCLWVWLFCGELYSGWIWGQWWGYASQKGGVGEWFIIGRFDTPCRLRGYVRWGRRWNCKCWHEHGAQALVEYHLINWCTRCCHPLLLQLQAKWYSAFCSLPYSWDSLSLCCCTYSLHAWIFAHLTLIFAKAQEDCATASVGVSLQNVSFDCWGADFGGAEHSVFKVGMHGLRGVRSMSDSPSLLMEIISEPASQYYLCERCSE